MNSYLHACIRLIKSIVDTGTHLVFRNVDGRPEVVDESLLPDRFTDMDLEALLRMCADCQAPDMEAVTELALYGMRSLTACQPTTRSWLLYRGGVEGAAFLRTNRDKQRDGYATPRVSQPEAYPRFDGRTRVATRGPLKARLARTFTCMA